MLPMRRIVVRLLLIPAALLVLWSWREAKLPVTDFSSYWVAGHALLEHQNPYDAVQALRMERALGFSGERPFVMRNPPWTLWLTLPLGLLGHSPALLLWSCVLVAALIVSARMFARDANDERVAVAGSIDNWRVLIATFIFAPALICLSVGQTAPIVLLGIAAFALLIDRHDFWAGAALLLAAAKPQIALLFWVVLVLWIADQRRWRVLAGGVSAGVAAVAIAIAFDPHVLSHYTTMLRAETIQAQFIPTLGGWLRWRFGWPLLQIMPAVIGIAGAVVHYARHRHQWEWQRSLPVLLLASIVVAPYAWFFDEVVVLAALLPLAKRARMPLVAAFIMANAAILVTITSGVRVVSPWYVWTPWAWIGLYALATRAAHSHTRQERVPAAAK